MTTGKTTALTIQIFVGKWCLCFLLCYLGLIHCHNFSSKEQVSFLNFMAAVTICSDFGAQENTVTVSIVSASICHEVMGLDAMIFIFWKLSFKPAFPLSFFTLIKQLFSSSSLSAMRVVSSAYLRLLTFLPAILIPACESSSWQFLMMSLEQEAYIWWEWGHLCLDCYF